MNVNNMSFKYIILNNVFCVSRLSISKDHGCFILIIMIFLSVHFK